MKSFAKLKTSVVAASAAMTPSGGGPIKKPSAASEVGVCPTFLKGAEQDVEEQQRRDHQRREQFAQEELRCDDRAEYPWRGRPEMERKSPERMDRFFDDGVGAKFCLQETRL